jgi:enoyl-[acyl-carrier protein] reductase I
MYNFNAAYSPLGRNMTLEDIGGAGLFLLSDLSSGITGETLYVDAGFHNMGVPDLTLEMNKD